MACFPGLCCGEPRLDLADPVLAAHDTHMAQDRCAGYLTVITAVALVAIAACLAAGCMTPGIEYHIAAYIAAGCLALSVIPFAVASIMLCREDLPAPQG